MICPQQFHQFLLEQTVDFYCGVPDSLLKNFCTYIDSQASSKNHIITANEGSALSLATGYQMGTGKLPLVYLQNSGLGNLVNPLLSLVDEAVYSIPVLIMIGWRGEILSDGKQLKDEPQHKKQGELTLPILETMQVPYQVLSADSNYKETVSKLIQIAKTESRPVALVIRKNTFSPSPAENKTQSLSLPLEREEAIETIAHYLPSNMPIVSTTGMISRELFETRIRKGQSNHSDFLTVGSMGHSSQIALGVAIAKPNQKIACLDGDGAFLMHMGGASNLGTQENLIHIILNNGCHDSVGGQPTQGFAVDFLSIAKACLYSNFCSITTKEALEKVLSSLQNKEGSIFIEVKVKAGHRKDLGRPTISPKDSKQNFIQFLNSTS